MHIKSKQILIFLILSILFILSMFYRVSNAIIAPHLVKDLNLNAEELGILGGAFFWSFALFQIPMGPMLDRIGPRIIITIFTFIGASGAFVFAIGKSFIILFFGRILMGMGMASVLMGSFKVLTLRFPSNRFSSLSGLLVSIGAFGNLLAATPLAYLDHVIGWRIVFIFASIITTFFAFLIFWSLTETGIANMGSGTLSSQKKIGFFQSIQTIAGSLSFWQISAAAFFRYGTFISLQGLWLGFYLMDVKG
ncbi:MAG TPA: thiamine biosynthesis protein ThiF, partial [Deltaproteobacteria bacterium]|nr:thiamine biosynthesis protein ThiF [Deltaproteobacteria bacterium]